MIRHFLKTHFRWLQFFFFFFFLLLLFFFFFFFFFSSSSFAAASWHKPVPTSHIHSTSSKLSLHIGVLSFCTAESLSYSLICCCKQMVYSFSGFICYIYIYIYTYYLCLRFLSFSSMHISISLWVPNAVATWRKLLKTHMFCATATL